MKKVLICEVDEDYLNELCEVFKKKPLGGIPTHRAWALLEGLKNGIALDELTNGEVIQKIFKISDAHGGMSTMFAYTRDDRLLTADIAWWDAKWGE